MQSTDQPQGQLSPNPEPPPIAVRELRVSLIWVEALPETFADSPPQQSALPMIFDPVKYRTLFDSLQQGPSQAAQLPWPSGKNHLFWTYYLERRQPSEVRGQDAWKALVPFRFVPETRATLAGPSHVITEAFCYPGAIAVLVTLRLTDGGSLDETVDRAQEVRRGRVLRNSVGKALTLDEHAAACLGEVRSKALGLQEPLPSVPRDPFTLATTINAAGVDAAAPWLGDARIQRALEGLTQWSATWKANALPPPAECQLPSRTAPPSHVVYGRKRGRAVWFPARFSSATRLSTTPLSCYHRNLAMASMQTEALMVICKIAESETGKGLSALLRECARNASALLGRSFAGISTVYRSASIKAQIEQHPYRASVNAMRTAFGMPPI